MKKTKITFTLAPTLTLLFSAAGLSLCVRASENHLLCSNDMQKLATADNSERVDPVTHTGAPIQYCIMRRAAVCVLMIMMLTAPAGEDATAEEMTPWDRAVSTPKGQLESPYPYFTSVAEEGYRKYMAAGCNGCHGGGGGGGMAAPLTNSVWIYGDDDDTLFRVIALGTGSLSPGNAFGKLGYRRTGSEAVVGPMPDFGDIVRTDDDLWKIIAWMRSVYCERRDIGC